MLHSIVVGTDESTRCLGAKSELPCHLSRRQILRRMAGAAAMAPWCTKACLGQAAPSEGGCTLGFSTYGMPTLTTERGLQALADIGFDAVEIAVRSQWDADSAELTPRRRQRLRNLLRDLPLRLTSLMEHVAATDDQLQRVAVERLKLAVDLAHDLAPHHPPLVQTVLGSGDFMAQREKLCDRLGQWLAIADASETTIAIKPHRGGVVSKPSEAVWILDRLGNPDRLKMVYDYSHYALRDLPMKETIATALPYTAHIAVKDVDRDGDRIAFKLPGEAGTIDFVSLIRQFYVSGYRGDINCEVSSMVSRQPRYYPLVAARTCYQNMAAAFKKAQVPRRRPS